MVRGSDIIIALIAIIFPPAAVAMMTGCSCDLLICIALTMLVRHRPCLPLGRRSARAIDVTEHRRQPGYVNVVFS